MPVPETAVDEKCDLSARENQIRRSGKFSHVKSEPEAEPMRGTSHQQFGPGSFPSNAAHHFGPTSRGDNICH
jgi:hypothetical protein